MLQEAELSGLLIQRTTSEAPQRLCITSDWMFTRSRATGHGPDEDARNTVKRSCSCCRERQSRPAIVSGVLKPVKKPGSEGSVRVSDDVC